jgi:hypothetical protein
LRRVSSVLDQKRLAFDKRLAERAALLIVEFNLHTFSQCFVSNSGANDLTGSGSLMVIVVLKHMQWHGDGQDRADKLANAAGPSVKASHASTPRRA